MSAVLDYLVAFLLLSGGAFALVGSIGLAKLDDTFKRLHGPTKASTLGVGGVLLGSMLLHAMQGSPGLRELLITLFLFLTAPVSAYMVARAVLSRDASLKPPLPPSPADEP